MLFFVILFFLSCYPSDNPCVWLILLEYSTLVLLPPNFSAGHHTLTLSWPYWNAFFHNLFFNHSMTLATTLLWVLQWASSDWHLTISLSFLIYSFDVDLALWLLGMGEMIFAQESTLPSSPPPVASIQNKANSPFHPPGLFYFEGQAVRPYLRLQCWYLELNHDVSIYTVEISKHYIYGISFLFFLRELVYQFPLKQVHLYS